MAQAFGSDASVRDPMKQEHWAPAMAFAWALWHSSERVSWTWYVNADRYQSGTPISLHGVLWHAELEEREASSDRGDDPRVYRNRTSDRVQTVISQFTDALTNGRIRGFGTDPANGECRAFQAKDWTGADLYSLIDNGRTHDAIYPLGNLLPLLRTVRFLSKDVVKEFCTNPSTGRSDAKPHVSDSQLRQFMARLPSEPPLTQDATLSMARNYFHSNTVSDKRCRKFHTQYYTGARRPGENEQTLEARKAKSDT